MISFLSLKVLSVLSDLTTFIRDNTNTKSMKIVHFSRPITPLSIYAQNSSTSLSLNIQFQTLPPPLQMITNQLKENTIQGWLLYVIRSFIQVGFRCQYKLLILSGFPLTSFHLAKTSLSAFSWLYSLVCAVVQKHHL